MIPFGKEVPYLGFHWNLRTQVVHLPDEKKAKYLAAIEEWKAKCTHNLLETQKLYGKLSHAALVIPAGRAHLTNMEAMLASFNDSPFLPHTPPRGNQDDLTWWQSQLQLTNVSIPIPRPHPLNEHRVFLSCFALIRLHFTTQIHWTASFPFSFLPYTEAHVRYHLVAFSCMI